MGDTVAAAENVFAHAERLRHLIISLPMFCRLLAVLRFHGNEAVCDQTPVEGDPAPGCGR